MSIADDVFIPHTCFGCGNPISQEIDYADEIESRYDEDDNQQLFHPRCAEEWDKENPVALVCINCGEETPNTSPSCSFADAPLGGHVFAELSK